MANHETKTITIYQKNYQLPILNGGSFEEIQSQTKQRQQVIKNQRRFSNVFTLNETVETNFESA